MKNFAQRFPVLDCCCGSFTQGMAVSFLLVGLLAILNNTPMAMAQEYMGDDFTHIIDPDSEIPQQPYRPATEQQYLPSPPASLPPAKEKPPFLHKFLKPFAKRASLPINLTPKFPKDSSKDPPPAKDPLLRLQRSFVFEGQLIPAGFYLVSVEAQTEPDGAQEGETAKPQMEKAWIVLSRQQEAVAKIPALKLSAQFQALPGQTIASSDVEEAPENSYFKPDEAQQNKVNESLQATKPEETLPLKETQPALVRVTLSQDQNFLMFIYTDLKAQFQSVPIPLSPY